MFSSVPLMAAFTVLFLVTGVYSVVRLAALASGIAAAVDRAAELAHVLMSVAMIAMTWGLSGGPSSPSGVLQIVVFSLVGLYFLLGAVRGYRAPVAGGYHLVMALAMIWMVAAVPLLMGAGHSSAAAMEGMPRMSAHGAAAAAPVDPTTRSWVLPVSVVLVALLVAAALFWAVRAARQPGGRLTRCAPAGAARNAEAGACAEAGSCAETGTGAKTGSEVGVEAGPVAVAVATAPPRRVGPLLSQRADAACHVLMSAGMAGMLAAML